jgi:hypothetical protein
MVKIDRILAAAIRSVWLQVVGRNDIAAAANLGGNFFGESYAASVACWGFPVTPLAIFLTEGAIIVDAIERIVRKWSLTHIFEDIGEAISAEPSFVDCDASGLWSSR